MREPTRSRRPSACKGCGGVAQAPPPPRCAPDVAVDLTANPRASVPSSRQEGGDQGGSAKAAFPLAEAAPPRQSRTVLQTLCWGGFGPGPAWVPAALPSPADSHGPPPPPAPRSIRSPLTPAPFTLKRLDPRPHRCTASFLSAAGTEEALPKPREQSIVEVTEGGVNVGQGREKGRNHAVPTAEAKRLDERLCFILGLGLRSDLGPVPSIPGVSVPVCEIARAVNNKCQGFHPGATRPRDQPRASRCENRAPCSWRRARRKREAA